MTSPLPRRSFIAALGYGGMAVATSSLARAATTPRLRVGQIGTTHAHAAGKMASLRRSNDFEVVGIVEPDETLRNVARKRREFQGLTWMTEEQLLNSAGLSAVAIGTEINALLSTAARCVQAGKHLHLDKPAGESLAELRQVMHAATQRSLIIQLGYMFRYNAGFELAHSLVQQGILGRVFSVEAAMGKLADQAERRRVARYPGGPMFELGCHLIDATVDLLGKPVHVVPFATPGRGAGEVRHQQVAVLEYPAAVVTIRASLSEVNGGARRQFVICGENGTLELRPLEPPSAQLWLTEARGPYARGLTKVPLPNRPRYDADFTDLAKAIRQEKPFAWSPQHDLDVQETVIRASGLPVR